MYFSYQVAKTPYNISFWTKSPKHIRNAVLDLKYGYYLIYNEVQREWVWQKCAKERLKQPDSKAKMHTDLRVCQGEKQKTLNTSTYE